MPFDASTVLSTLEKLHEPPRTFLDFDSPFHLLVATILSAQCTDKRVNMVTPALFKKYPLPQDFLAVPEEELRRDIFTCGHYNNKAKYLRETSRILVEKFNSEVPQTMEELLTLLGVGRKTATVVLYAAFQRQEGIAVDTHVWRVSKRLGLTKANSQGKIELDLMRQTPRAKWGLFHTLLITHGRTVCTARNRQCEKCPFKNDCPSSLVTGKIDLAKK
ncbi:MAG: endonuclease III [Candidatus Peribacteraceae bacterium]|nr:endonuclease III [Candidatus Peribacteraceae bacterium]